MLLRLAALLVLAAAAAWPGVQATGTTSTFLVVMDTTASMGDDIQQVCGVMSQLTGSISQRFTDFCLVPFNDQGSCLPPYGPVTCFPSAELLRQAVCRYIGRVCGGGDCPELSLSGVNLALQVAGPNSLAVVFTDASAKDLHQLQTVLLQVQAKQIPVFYLLSGHCGNSRSAGYLAYNSVSTLSGGQVFVLNEANIPALLRSVVTTQGSLECPAVPLLIQTSSPSDWRRSFTVPLGTETITAQVSCTRSRPAVTLTPGTTRTSRVNLPNGVILTATNPQSGIWSIRVGSTSECSVKLSATGCGIAFLSVLGYSTSRSPSTITPLPQEQPSFIHLQTLPRASINTLRFISTSGRVLAERSLSGKTSDAEGRLRLGRYQLPGEPFRLQIIGTDQSGRSFVAVSSVAYDVSQLIGVTSIDSIPLSNRFNAIPCSEVTIRCSVQIQGTDIPVAWSRRGQAVVADGRRVAISGARGEILTINTVLHSDAGIYTCAPAVVTGTRASASIYMSVTGNAGSSEDCDKCILLMCPFSPVQSWYHNNTRVSRSRDYNITEPGKLQSCRRPLADRAGLYKCLTASGEWSFTVSSTFQTAIGRSSSSILSESSVLGGCQAFGIFSNGAVSYSLLGAGARGTFTCNTGFVLRGSATADCLSGGWSSSAPLCTRPPTTPPPCRRLDPFPNGFVIYTPGDSGARSRARIACQTGFGLQGPSSLVCLNGQWSPSILSVCRMIATPPPIPRVAGGCLYFSAVRSGRVSYQTTRARAGTRATFLCDSGFAVRGSATSDCVSGTWTSPVAGCVLRPATTPPPPPSLVNGGCAFFGSVNNGRVSYRQIACATRATFSCDSGHQVQGSATSHCLAGAWSSPAASCALRVPSTPPPEEVATVAGGCTPFRDVPNGKMSRFSLGGVTIMSLTCNLGYMAEGSSSAICRGGFWNPRAMECVPEPTIPSPTTQPCVEHTGRIRALEQQVKLLQQTVRDKNAVISNLTDEVETVRATAIALRTDNKKKEEAIGSLSAVRTQNVVLTQRVGNMQVTVKSLREQNTELTEDAEQKHSELTGCQDKLTRIGVIIGTCPSP